jgi:hypothetical protein
MIYKHALATPKKILEQAQLASLPSIILEVLAAAVEFGPLLELLDTKGAGPIYRWCFDRAGRRRQYNGDAEAEKPSPRWRSQVRMINKFDEVLSKLTEGHIDPIILSSDLGVIGRSPAWSSVRMSAERLAATPDSESYSEKESDDSTVNSYFNLLQRSAANISLAVFCGTVLGYWAKGQTSGERTLSALETISRIFDLVNSQLESTRSALMSLTFELGSRLNIDTKSLSEASLADEQMVQAWSGAIAQATGEAIRAISTEERKSLLETAEQTAWAFCLKLLQGEAIVPGLDIVICAVADSGPFSFFRLPVGTMNIRDWSVALISLIPRLITRPGRPVPAWP